MFLFLLIFWIVHREFLWRTKIVFYRIASKLSFWNQYFQLCLSRIHSMFFKKKISNISKRLNNTAQISGLNLTYPFVTRLFSLCLRFMDWTCIDLAKLTLFVPSAFIYDLTSVFSPLATPNSSRSAGWRKGPLTLSVALSTGSGEGKTKGTRVALWRISSRLLEFFFRGLNKLLVPPSGHMRKAYICNFNILMPLLYWRNLRLLSY